MELSADGCGAWARCGATMLMGQTFGVWQVQQACAHAGPHLQTDAALTSRRRLEGTTTATRQLSNREPCTQICGNDGRVGLP